MATRGRLSQLRVVDPVLTELARGYSNSQYIADVLFPIVNVPKEAVTVPTFGKEAFLLWDTERAIRAASNIMLPRGLEPLDVILTEHDISYPIDVRESAESLFNEEEAGTYAAQEAIDLRREYQCAQIAQNPANYLPGAKVALSGSSKWSNSGGDPIDVVETAKEFVRQQIGKYPNAMFMGPSGYLPLKWHEKLAAKFFGSQERKMITAPNLQDIFEIKRVVIGNALVAANSKHPNNITTSDIWGDNIILAYIPEYEDGREPNYREPSFAYTLRREGYPQADKYNSIDGKVQYIRSTDLYKPVIVGKDAGYLISGVR